MVEVRPWMLPIVICWTDEPKDPIGELTPLLSPLMVAYEKLAYQEKEEFIEFIPRIVDLQNHACNKE